MGTCHGQGGLWITRLPDDLGTPTGIRLEAMFALAGVGEVIPLVALIHVDDGRDHTTHARFTIATQRSVLGVYGNPTEVITERIMNAAMLTGGDVLEVRSEAF